ncbi:MAG TPA: carboxypeptidase-like regulatory domain-containing protein [Terracidiphilus sp.]|nr:carboxypeptidase-like regulatory domain-containing protein [Terracidiphilus sp.]
MLFALWIALLGFPAMAQANRATVFGTVLDPSGLPVAGAQVEIDSPSGVRVTAKTNDSGTFVLAIPAWGSCTVHITAVGFAELTRRLDLNAASANLTLRFERLAPAAQEVIVSADVGEISLDSPDPAQKILVREELLDANPGRPGAPVSLPGLPIETASGGIKAPQYFVPGVAGDHGEPIAQYIAVGDYLASNNLSANAHGNGYADPNIYISAALGSVETDGGAFNVLEGNHALNLAAFYRLRPSLQRFLTLTGDYRDIDLAGSLAPADTAKKAWLALEANYGNGLMRTLEHRQQFKWNAMRVLDPGRHQITLLGIGYYGRSHEGNLVPIGYAVALNDTIDPRQQDQTHTCILAANDIWKPGSRDAISSSAFFRTYNLALFSNFGEGLIRQSEFRTVEGTELREAHTFASWFEAMAGLDYNEDDIHRDNLDHYLSGDPHVFGLFVKVLANNIAIREVAPFVAAHTDLGAHLHLYGGLRHEQAEMNNTDMLKPEQSYDAWRGFENPKATLTWTPGAGPERWLPSASLSIGQAFFTQDPRISTAEGSTPGAAAQASPFERSHSAQLVLEKEIRGSDMRLTLGRTTTTATLAKIDPDNGLADDEGPGTLKFLTASVRRSFSFGMAQFVVSKADARDDDTGLPAAEAPRTILDVLTTLDKLPFGLQGRAEYEYVGHKFLDVGNPDHPLQYEAIPVGETRLALVRPLLNGRLQLGVEGMIARGYTGQTTETFALGWQVGNPPPACAPGVDGIANDFDCGSVERAVGIRMVSWAGASVSWRFGAGK